MAVLDELDELDELGELDEWLDLVGLSCTGASASPASGKSPVATSTPTQLLLLVVRVSFNFASR